MTEGTASIGTPFPAPRRTVLVVDDEPKIREVVREAIGEVTDHWFDAGTAAEGLRIAACEHPDLIILDLGLPDMDGMTLCQRLRAISAAPIVVLSARQNESDKVALLEAGADDYVSKPFGPVELRARVRAQLRRARMRADTPRDQPIVIGDLVVDIHRRTVSRGAHSVHLTPTEWALLIALSTSPGRTLTHQQLFKTVWGEAHGQPQQYLRVYITHLRRKVEVEPYAPRLIVTEPGVGYRFEVDR